MLQVEAMRRAHLPQVCALIGHHLQFAPPGGVLPAEEIAAVIDDPLDWSREKYPDESDGTIQSLVALVGDTVAAAAQIVLHEGRSEGGLLWIVGQPQSEQAISALTRAVVAATRAAGHARLVSSRNPFTVGWAGVPNTWPWVLRGASLGGLSVEERWCSFSGRGRSPHQAAPPGLAADSVLDSNRRILTIIVRAGDQALGRAEVWLPGRLLPTLSAQGAAALEYIEVAPPFQGKGWGAPILATVAGTTAQFGIHDLVLWTRAEHVAMQKVAERAGFAKGPDFCWLST